MHRWVLLGRAACDVATGAGDEPSEASSEANQQEQDNKNQLQEAKDQLAELDSMSTWCKALVPNFDNKLEEAKKLAVDLRPAKKGVPLCWQWATAGNKLKKLENKQGKLDNEIECIKK